jgi:hypothetical protein
LRCNFQAGHAVFTVYQKINIMKRICSVFFALMIASGIAMAADKPVSSSAVAVVKNGSVFKLFYKATGRTDVKIAIYAADDKLVFSETLRQVDGFLRPYNFSKLPEGEYTLEVTDESGRKVERLSYIQGKIQNIAKVVRVAGEDHKYLLSVPNKGSDVLTVKIYNADGNILYTGTEAINGDFARIYNLKELNGKFSFEISDQNGVTKTIRY